VLAAGADDFLPKPFDFSALYDCMARHLGARFVHVESPAPPPASRFRTGDRAALAELPGDVREGLALPWSPSTRRGSRGHHPGDGPRSGTGGALGHHAGRLEYTLLLQALHDATARRNPPGAEAA